ncbi:MAG TPA: hypothetical protein VMJ12_06280 [Candidatus Acidoferrales bacterium]|nr:hypothetical protein [Candidatus Acidoferrales bacterium]
MKRKEPLRPDLSQVGADSSITTTPVQFASAGNFIVRTVTVTRPR